MAVEKPLPEVGLVVNFLAPEIDAEDVNGRRFKLSDFRGKVVFLDFWGDWCPYCRHLYPYKRELMKKFGDRAFTVLGIDGERHADKDQARRVMQREQINWPTWWFAASLNGQMVSLTLRRNSASYSRARFYLILIRM